MTSATHIPLRAPIRPSAQSPARLPHRLRILARMVRMNVMLTLEYRVGFFLSMGNLVLRPAVALLVWLAASDAGVQLPYDRQQFVTYFVLMGLVSLATQTWTAEYVEEDIRTGDLNKSLLRPAPNVLHYVANNAGEKLVKVVLLLPAILLLTLAFRHELRLPADAATWLLFAVAVALAAVLDFLIDYLTGSLAFFLQDVNGVLSLQRLCYGLLAGRFVPLAFFPPSLAGLLEAQPFRYTLSFPLEVLTAGLSPSALARGFAWQAGYCLALLLAYRLVWRQGLRAYSATGA
jgi:ABC-2 type transport system permease protein